MTTIPSAWNNSHNNQIPGSWNNADRNSYPELWHEENLISDAWQEKRQLPDDWNSEKSNTPSEWNPTSQLPLGWNSDFNLPNNWGTTSAVVSKSANSASTGASLNIGEKARKGAALFSAAAGKIGNAAKNAAGNAVDFAKSDAVKEKFDSAKNGMKNASGMIGSAFGDAKDKVSDVMNRNADESAEMPVENSLTENADVYHQSDYPESMPNAEQQNTDVILENQDMITESDFSDSSAEDTSVSSQEVSLSDEGTSYVKPVQQQNNSGNSYGNGYSSPYQRNTASQPVQQQNNPENSYGNGNSSPYQRNTASQPAQQHYQNNYQPSDSNSSYRPQYVIQEQKSPLVPILCGVIGVLAVGGGVLGGMLLMKNKENKSNNNIQSSSELKAEIVTTAESESTTDAVVTEATANTEAVVTEAVTTVVETAENPVEAYATILDMYYSNIVNNWVGYEDGVQGINIPSISDVSYPLVLYNKEAGLDETGYKFLDINGDGISELITGSATGAIYDIYTISNGEIKHLAAGGERDRFEITSANEIVENGSGGAAYSVRTFYKIENGMLIPLRQSEYDDGTIYYSDTFNGLDFINLKIVDLMESYETKNIMFTSFDNYKPSGAVQPVTTTQAATKPNTPSTDEFIATGKIITEKDPLNMRSAPDANADVIYKIPKGAYVGIIRTEGNWLYVLYYETETSPKYYGYVALDYVDVTWLDSYPVTYTSSDLYGTIYSSTGAKIYGFSSSYVIDGSSTSYVRTDLTHGWHVKAVRTCLSHGVRWYELYDADDGDYYGWVDSSFISFY